MMDNIIKEIKLQLGKKEVSLTVEQAKKLKEALEEMFGEKIIREEHHHYEDWWRFYWPEPYKPMWPIWVGSDTITTVSPYRYQTNGGCDYSYSNNTLTMKVV
jgi:hypothetical protein